MSGRTLSDLLSATRARRDKVAIGLDSRQVELTYGELDALANQVADQLRGWGVGASDAIAVIADNCLELAVAIFGISATGAAVAPLNPALAPAELSSRLDALKATAAIVPAHLFDGFRSVGATTWRLELDRAGLRASLTGAKNVRAGTQTTRAALLMFTTGTTAAPKIVVVTEANLAASIDGIAQTYRLSPEDTTLLVMPLFHGHGLMGGLLSTLASGGTAYLPATGRFSASRFWPAMSRIHATWYTAVPTIHQILLARAATEYPRDHAPRLRFIRSCSAPIATTVAAAVESTFHAPLIVAYGMTETAHQTSSNPLPSAGRAKPGSVGLPTGVEVRALGDAAEGASGEICVRGPTVTPGYLDNPEANAASFTDGWFHTGDLGRRDRDGYLFLTGRSKDIINRGGEKISPEKVDEILLSHPQLQDAASFGVPDREYGEEVVATVVLKPGETLSEKELAQYARARLSAYETPKRFYFADRLPRTSKGSVDRRKLTSMFADAP